VFSIIFILITLIDIVYIIYEFFMKYKCGVYYMGYFLFFILFEIENNLNKTEYKKYVKKVLKCPGICLDKFLDCAFRAIIEAKLDLVDKDEALDALWEYLVNIDYEVKLLEKRINTSKTTEEGTT